MSAVARRVLQIAGGMGLQLVLLLGAAGSLTWTAAWVYVGLDVAIVLVGWLTLAPGHQGVIAERSRGIAGTAPWDLLITRVLRVAGLGVLVVAGLDERWAWSAPLSLAVRVGGAVLLLAGYALAVWAMWVNPFFAQAVRVQTERGHTVVTTGPYAHVRHPGYVGMVLSMFGVPWLLDSPWALVPWALYAGTLVLRTSREDRLLADELPGYVDYQARTPYRLVPGVW